MCAFKYARLLSTSTQIDQSVRAFADGEMLERSELQNVSEINRVIDTSAQKKCTDVSGKKSNKQSEQALNVYWIQLKLIYAAQIACRLCYVFISVLIFYLPIPVFPTYTYNFICRYS